MVVPMGGLAEDTVLFIVMEYCGFQDLEQKIRRYIGRRELMDER
jgi:hypothetical protein